MPALVTTIARAAQGTELRKGVVYYDTPALSLKRQDLVRLLAWYGAIRAKSGRPNPMPLVNRSIRFSKEDRSGPDFHHSNPNSQKMKAGKVGLVYNKVTRRNQTIAQKGFDCVSVVDGITFGVLDGKRFHSARRDWLDEDIKAWAESNAIFFERLANNLRNFAHAKPIKLEEAH